jgi:EAL domain-containing protein (putative c-di-GMP-specific phosphodiesterase class I)/FixJ family two-component response regulator
MLPDQKTLSSDAPKGPSILIIDDSDDDFALLSRHIRKRWAQAMITHGASRTELIKLVSQQGFDVVICDHSMPDMDSTQARETLRSLGCDAPVIVCSGWADEQVGIAAMNDGARDFVEKGRPDRLIPVMERELSTRQLILEKEHVAQQAIAAGRVDTLTQLPNLTHFEELTEALNAQGGETLLLTLALEGLNRQRKSLRAGVEQSALIEFSNQLKTLFPKHALGRISDFEFAVCLKPAEGQWDLPKCIEEIYNRFDQPFSMRGQRISLDIQMGSASNDFCGNDAKEMLAHAGSAMRLARNQNLHADILVDPAFHQRARRHQTIEYSLASAIQDGELQLFFQPVINLPSRLLCSVECLVRWQHPVLGRLSPDEFIGIAEESGLIVQLGAWVLRSACEALKTIHAAGYPIAVAINCSSPEMSQPDFAGQLLNYLVEHKIDRRFFELEITESAALTDFGETVKILERLHSAGVSLAIDDFGTGFSSLNYLRKLPVDVLKIDKSFVQEMTEFEDSSKIVRAIIGLGKSLGLTIHAEGIEHESQAEMLNTWGCNRLQGYWISKPLDMDSFLTWLQAEGRAFLPEVEKARVAL